MRLIHLAFRFALLAGLAASPHVRAASFDCAGASGLEQDICTHPDLSRLDESLAQVYRKAMAQSADPGTLRKEQRNWIRKQRDTCDTYECLAQTYEARIAALRNFPDRAALQRLSGDYIRVVKGIPDENEAHLAIGPAGNGHVSVKGTSLWVHGFGEVHDGEVDGSALVAGDIALVQEKESSDCHFAIRFDNADALTVSNDNGHCGGMNVTFDGEYRKAAIPRDSAHKKP